MTSADIKIAVEQPDMISTQCEEHLFYVKTIDSKGVIIVYAQKDSPQHANIICADWLQVIRKKEREVEKGC